MEITIDVKVAKTYDVPEFVKVLNANGETKKLYRFLADGEVYIAYVLHSRMINRYNYTALTEDDMEEATNGVEITKEEYSAIIREKFDI